MLLVGESPLTLASQQEVACFNCSNEIIKNFPRSLHSLVFINYTFIRLLNSSVCKSYSVWVVLLYADFDRKLIN